MKTLTLNKQGYIIKGIADLTCWGGGNGCIKMKSFRVKSLKEIKNNLNDNGFGVQSINGAICDIYDDFGKIIQYRRTITIGKVSDNTINCVFDNS